MSCCRGTIPQKSGRSKAITCLRLWKCEMEFFWGAMDGMFLIWNRQGYESIERSLPHKIWIKNPTKLDSGTREGRTLKFHLCCQEKLGKMVRIFNFNWICSQFLPKKENKPKIYFILLCFIGRQTEFILQRLTENICNLIPLKLAQISLVKLYLQSF